jgi:hypothetical protein
VHGAILRSHGLDLGPAAPDGQSLIAEVKLAVVVAALDRPNSGRLPG